MSCICLIDLDSFRLPYFISWYIKPYKQLRGGEKVTETATAELTINIGELVVRKGSIEFPQYELLKSQVVNLSEHLLSVEVTPDNLRVSKQLLAAINKEVRKLHDEKMRVKRTTLEPYTDFENQVKDITGIVKDAEETIRNQVRELEEQERQAKKELIESIFNKRMKHYDFEELMGFDKFLKPTHLNKSMGINNIEQDMVKWLTKTEQNLDLIKSLDYSFEIIGEYQRSQDVASSIKSVQDRHKAIQEMERKAETDSKVSPKQTKPKKPIILIELTDEKDARLVEMFMKQERIDYTKSVK